MKFNFSYADDGKRHEYCVHCHAEALGHMQKDGKTYLHCAVCTRTSERALVIDPDIMWWVSPDGDMHHESAGVFIRNTEGKYLFFERIVFPFALTIPAGHIDAGEAARAAAAREVQEEVGITVNEDDLREIMTEEVVGDACWRGCDVHTWHAFLAVLDHDQTPTINEEGLTPMWLTLAEATSKDMVLPVRYIIDKFQSVL